MGAVPFWREASQLAAQARTMTPEQRAELYIRNGYQWTGSSWSKTTGISEKTLMAVAGFIPVAGPAFQQVQAAASSIQSIKPKTATPPANMGTSSPSFTPSGAAPQVSQAGFPLLIGIVLVGVAVGFLARRR